MNILYISQFFHPEITAGAFRAFENASYWEQQNNTVTIVTTYPNYPNGKIFTGYENKLFSKQVIQGLDVIRIKSIMTKNTNKFSRVVIYLSFVFFCFINMIIGKLRVAEYDVVLGSSGPIFTPIFAYVVAKLRKIPFVLELRDITFVQMLGTFSTHDSIYFKMMKRLELYLCQKASRVIVTTHSFKRILTQHDVAEEKIDVIPNGVLVEKKDNPLSEDIEQDRERDSLVFCYAGTFGISQDLIDLVRFFEEIPLDNKKLFLIGDGAEKEKISDYISERHSENVTILAPMSKEKLHLFYRQVDICLVKLKNTVQFSNFIPSKLFDIMINRKSVLYIGPKGEVTDIIDKANCGLSLCGEQYMESALQFSQFTNQFRSLQDLKLDLIKKGYRRYDYCIKHYNRELLAQSYLQILERLIKER